MGIGNFIKKLIETNAIWGVRAKQLAGINDAGNVITTSIVVSTTDNSIDFAPLPVPSFFKVGQYIRIFGGPNDSKLLRISKILEGTKLIVEEPVIADSGTRRVTARLWEIHDDPSISRPSSSGSTMFNVHNRDNTGLPDGSALATTYAEHYHDEEDDFIEAFVPYGEIEKSGYLGKKGQWSWNQKEETLLFCIASNTWVDLYTLQNIKIDNFIKIASLIDGFVPPSLVPNSNATGKKGQWSIQVGHSLHKGYFKLCIGTDTWIRFEVETLF